MQTKNRPYRLFPILSRFFISSLLLPAVHAGIVLDGTRVVFPAQEKEVTLQITNDGKTPSLVQVWLDRGDEADAPDNIEVPFLITPTLSRVDPQAKQVLRIFYSGEPLAQDRETLFWLNVLDIPPKDAKDANSLQIAFRTRIKLMYRPMDLPGDVNKAPEQLIWSIREEEGKPMLQARNPSAYVTNLGYIALESEGQTFEAGPGHVLPGATADFPVRPSSKGETPPAKFPAGTAVVYSSLNDWGASKGHKAELTQ